MATRAATRQWAPRGRWIEGLESRTRSMAYADTSKRDLRLDLLRGLAVAIMVVDHIGGDTVLTQLSGGNRFIVSAAEAFVFLSGIVVGLVYGDRLARLGPREAFKGLLRRAFTLYKASVGMALVFLALLLGSNVRLWAERSAGQSVDLKEVVAGILTLRHSFHGSDVLVMYTLMLLVAPVVLYLLEKKRTLPLLGVSVAIWGLNQLVPGQGAFPWKVEESHFPVAAWQLLFVLGIVVGFHRDLVSRWVLAGSAGSRAAVFGLGGLAYLLAWSSERFGATSLPALLGGGVYSDLFLKESLAPGRVLAFLGVAVIAYTLVSALWVPLRAGLGWLLIPFGQNSLYVYIMHLFVLVAVYNLAPLAMPLLGDGVNLAAQLLGLATVWVMIHRRVLFRLVPR